MALRRPKTSTAATPEAEDTTQMQGDTPEQAPVDQYAGDDEDELDNVGKGTAFDEADRRTRVDNSGLERDARPVATQPAPKEESALDIVRGSQKSGDGFDDLDDDLGWNSFPLVKLQDGSFLIKDSDEEFGHLDVVILSTQKKWLYKARQSTSEDEEIPIAFTYDDKLSTKGIPLQEVFDEWRQNGDMTGAHPVQAVYREVLAMILGTSDAKSAMNGKMVILNIPPTSRGKLSGYRKDLRLLKGLSLNEVVTRCSKGKRIENGQKSFSPWAFSLVGKAPATFAQTEVPEYRGTDEE